MHQSQHCWLHVHTGLTLLKRSYSMNHQLLRWYNILQQRTSQILDLHPLQIHFRIRAENSESTCLTLMVEIYPCVFLTILQRSQMSLFEGCHWPGLKVMTCTLCRPPGRGNVFLEKSRSSKTLTHLKNIKPGKSLPAVYNTTYSGKHTVIAYISEIKSLLGWESTYKT